MTVHPGDDMLVSQPSILTLQRSLASGRATRHRIGRCSRIAHRHRDAAKIGGRRRDDSYRFSTCRDRWLATIRALASSIPWESKVRSRKIGRLRLPDSDWEQTLGARSSGSSTDTGAGEEGASGVDWATARARNDIIGDISCASVALLDVFDPNNGAPADWLLRLAS